MSATTRRHLRQTMSKDTYLNDDRSQVLELFRSTLGCGTIRPDRSDRTLKYETRSVSDLATKVLPLFERHPLRSSKQKDFEKFAEIVHLMHESKHLQPDGFARIVDGRSRSTRTARSDSLVAR